MASKKHISDFLEQSVADILAFHKIKFIHESENNKSNLDFYLPDFDVYIEVKQYHSDRVLKQLSGKEDIILIQGKKSISMLKELLKWQEKIR
ncbi:hypothetical protein D9M68_551420 [compost metagenome]